MRGFGSRFDSVPAVPDTQSMVVLAANTPQAFDWPSNVTIVRVTGATTGSTLTTNTDFSFVFNPVSTFAVFGSSFAGSTASSGQNVLVNAAGKTFRVPGGSTGFSLSAGLGGLVGVEFWKIGG